jgi:hypothetical protein
MSKSTEINETQLAELNAAYPVSEDTGRLSLPRLGMLSKDITEVTGTGKAKKIKIIQSAGTFYTEMDKGEVNDEGKKVWTKEFIDGEEIEVIIPFHRYQLRRYDASLEKFYSTPIYDSAEQVLPLYLDKQVVQQGTQAELQAKYPKLTQKGKKSSDLKKYIILYVLYNGTMYQMNPSVSSGWAFDAYKRTVNPSTVLTALSSSEETFGDNTYRKMTFTNKRLINADDEFASVQESQGTLRMAVDADQKRLTASSAQDKELDDMAEEASKALEK